MAIRYACGVIGAALLAFAAVAQAQDQRVPRIVDQEEAPLAVVGCLQKESDYRRLHDTGEGGFLGTGAGMKNEYILVNAFPIGSPNAAAVTPGFCRPGIGGEAYELTGRREKELEAFAGRWVEITGIMKEADVVGTTGRPEGGYDFLGRDLKLFEVTVSAFKEPEVAVVTPTYIQPRVEFEAAPAPAPERVVEEPQQAPPAEVREELPKTASPLALLGLLGLLSIGGALGLRALR